MDLLKGWHQRAGEQLRTILYPPGMAAGRVGPDLRPMGIGRPGTSGPAQRETLQQIRQSLPMLDPSDRGGAGVRGGGLRHPVRPRPPRAAARGLAHRA